MQPVHCSLRSPEGDVQAPSNPSQRLWPTPASQPCLRQAGAWGGSLWNVQPVHCSLRIWKLPPRPAPLFFRVPKATSRCPQTLPSAFGLLLHRSLACVRREPGEGASGTCSPCTAALELSLWNLPLRPAPLFFRVAKATSALKPFPAPLAYSCVAAAAFASGGSVGKEALQP